VALTDTVITLFSTRLIDISKADRPRVVCQKYLDK
jgi:hypothetical protein